MIRAAASGCSAATHMRAQASATSRPSSSAAVHGEATGQQQVGTCAGAGGSRPSGSVVDCFLPHKPNFCSKEKCELVCIVFNYKRQGAYCDNNETPWMCCCPQGKQGSV